MSRTSRAVRPFDLLVDSKARIVADEPLSLRRAEVTSFPAKFLSKGKGCALSLATSQISVARDWLKTPEGHLHGLFAKRLELP